MEDLISVVIPVYNTEKYLLKCIESVIHQNYCNFEVILIDDGSKDKSGEICDAFAAEQNNIAVVHSENSGVSKARNQGIQLASGKYIAFIDSDDYLNKDYLKVLYENLKAAELSVCGYYTINMAGDVIKSNVIGQREYISISADNYMKNLFNGERGYQGFLWNKLFCTSIIKQHNLQFDEKIQYNEDRLFILHYLMFCKNVSYTNEPLYFYLRGGQGVMADLELGFQNNMISDLEAYEKMLSILHNGHLELYNLALMNACMRISMLKNIAGKNKDFIKYKNKWMRKLILSNIKLFDKLNAFCKLL